MAIRKLMIGALMIGTLFAADVRAGTVVDIRAVMDNTLYEDVEGDVSNGAGHSFFAGRTGEGFIRRGLLAFDIAGNIPAGSTIDAVQLTLHMSRTISGNRTINLHRAEAPWGEGDSDPGMFSEGGQGAPAAQGDATWIHRYFGTTSTWANAGGDFASNPSASTSVGFVGFYSWSSSDMVSDVQDWLDDPAINHGWGLIGDESSPGGAKRFDSRENDNSTLRPSLLIEYTPIPEPSSGLLAGCLLLGAVGRRRRRQSLAA